ncbi:hypothetical protein A3A67_04505 [Candidatus Peribacteria bacterium RIFCSPLOWO2_01_FULL_51_18]|nr:MAG: hypothetical protein A3A67_04505 [Candidatus Peribacteria bacterium RIFCSPLOWO2_01_FULL_51_18]
MFLAYIHIHDDLNVPADVMITRYAKVETFENIASTISELTSLLQKPTLPWLDISYAANHTLKSEQEAREWLNKILKILEEELEQRNAHKSPELPEK